MEQTSGSATPDQHDRRRFWLAVLGGWAGIAVILIAVAIPDIIAFRTFDPDDWMRLLEVRDLLAGQSWWDVAQHRLNGGDFPMHWSRLVDLPLAAIIAPLDPLLGQAIAERVAMVAVPLITLLAIIAGLAVLTRRLADSTTGIAAIPLVPLAIPVLMQTRPMRIDHHGWQIALAVWAVAGLVSRPTVRNGALTGLALATLVTISLEGLPITVAIAGIAALAWVAQPDERAEFTRGLAGTLFGAALLLHLGTRGPGAWAPACDAISPAYLATLGIAGGGMALATLFGRTVLPVRLAVLMVSGGLAAACFALAAPVCLKGPFEMLDPLVYRYWYLQVLEGMPVWRQGLSWALIEVALPVTGIVGAGLGWRAATQGRRMRWMLMIAAQLAAVALAIFVTRAGGTANALAIPGGAVLLKMLLGRARAIERPLPRIFATAGSLFAASPGIIIGLMLALTAGNATPKPVAGRRVPICADFNQVRVINALPASTIFAPIDLTPEILVNTHHRGVGAGYHRGAAAIHKVVAAFISSPADAQSIVTATGARYLVACAGSVELDVYRKAAPNGLWARLERGERVPWLTPIRLAGSPVLVWQVSPSAASPRPAPTIPHAAS